MEGAGSLSLSTSTAEQTILVDVARILADPCFTWGSEPKDSSSKMIWIGCSSNVLLWYASGRGWAPRRSIAEAGRNHQPPRTPIA
jgi:hypothetical protein